MMEALSVQTGEGGETEEKKYGISIRMGRARNVSRERVII
jgi:hypothetical protein